jgi:hypothetical protein
MSDIPVGGPGLPLAQGHLVAHRMLADAAAPKAMRTYELPGSLAVGPAPTLVLRISLGPGEYSCAATVLLEAADHAVDAWFVHPAAVLSGCRATEGRVVGRGVVALGPARVVASAMGNLDVMVNRDPPVGEVWVRIQTLVSGQAGVSAIVVSPL